MKSNRKWMFKNFCAWSLSLIAIAIPSQSGAADCDSSGLSSPSLRSQLTDVCEVYMNDPEFVKKCDQIKERELVIDCAGGTKTLLDRLNLRGWKSGIFKGAVKGTVGIASFVDTMTGRKFGDLFESAHAQYEIIYQLNTGQQPTAQQIERLVSSRPKSSREERSNYARALVIAMKAISQLSPSDLLKVKDLAWNFLINRDTRFNCLRSKAQEEFITSLIVEWTFPPATLIKFLSVAEKTTNIAKIIEEMGPLARSFEAGIAKTEARLVAKAKAKAAIETQSASTAGGIDKPIVSVVPVRKTIDAVDDARRAMEKEMGNILKRDPDLRNPRNEAQYYTLMQEYAKDLPEYKSVQNLVEAGILKVEEGKLVSNYNLSRTHLGVLQLEKVPDGSFRVIQNRGTDYFRGINHPSFLGGYSALTYIRSEPARQAYNNIQVVIAVPQNQVRRFRDPTTTEVSIPISELSQIPGIRIFRADVGFLDLNNFELGR